MFSVLTRHAKLIFTWGLIFAILSGGISMFFPKQYMATSQVLIISRDKAGVDPYTQSKAASTIGANLAQVMKTTDFYNKVMNSNATSFDRGQWQNLNDRDQRKKWTKDVQSSMVYGSSLMNINVYSYSQNEAVNLSNAITQTLTAQGWEYLGGDVAMKAISNPLVSRWFARPNILINSAVGFLVGASISGLWILRYKRRSLFGR
jgi:capsular polysaccharide biosynthesis protein